MSYSNIYTQKIMQSYHCKDFAARLDQFTGQCSMVHSACSDKAFVMVFVDDNKIISKIHLDVQGCILAVAAANIVGQYCLGKLADQVLAKTNEEIIEGLLGPDFLNTRFLCAALGLSAIKKLL